MIRQFLSPRPVPITYVLQLLGLTVVYLVTAQFGLRVQNVNGFATLIWAPTGIALATLLLAGKKYWPGIFLGAFLANNLTGAPWPIALGIATGNTLEAIAGLYFCSPTLGFHASLDRLQDSLRLVFGAAVVSTTISAAIGVFSLWAGGVIPSAEIVTTWLPWWAGDFMGALTVAPLILILSSSVSIERFAWRRDDFGINVGLSVLLIGFSAIVLSGMHYPQVVQVIGLRGIYILIPLLIWPSMRFGQKGAAVGAFVVSFCAIWFAVHKQGPFAESVLVGNPLPLMTFVAVIAMKALVFGSIVTEREIERQNLEISQVELSRAKEAAEAANLAKSGFLANMSHEIRTPLGLILGFSKMLVRGDMTAEERDNAVETIERNGRLLSNIIDDILDLSKVEAGKLAFDKTLVPVVDGISDVISLLKMSAAAKDLTLDFEFVQPLPHAVVTDPLRLRQILLNIIGNAVKFTDRGGVKVRIEMQNATPAGILGQ